MALEDRRRVLGTSAKDLAGHAFRAFQQSGPARSIFFGGGFEDVSAGRGGALETREGVRTEFALEQGQQSAEPSVGLITADAGFGRKFREKVRHGRSSCSSESCGDSS